MCIYSNNFVLHILARNPCNRPEERQRHGIDFENKAHFISLCLEYNELSVLKELLSIQRRY